MNFVRLTYVIIIVLSGTCLLAQPDPPENFRAQAYDRHIELRWDRSSDLAISTYRVFRENTLGDMELLGAVTAADSLYIDFVGAQDVAHTYTVTSRTLTGEESDTASHVSAMTYDMSDEEFMNMVQEYTFRYFWDFAHPASGLARERNSSGNTVTIGGSGFGVMAILVGIERGFITKEQGLDRLLKIVLFLENANRFHGVFPHWMHGVTGNVIPFSTMDNGGDLVETAFLFQGLLTVREYFDGGSVDEIVLRQKITDLWEQADWDWYRNNQNVLLWHWSPVFDFGINLQIRGWNEALIIYLLGIASPTHAIAPSLYHTGWAGGNYTNGSTQYGHKLYVGSNSGGPLFFAHYSFLGFDPRYHKDEYANYFIHNRNHTLVNRAYCIDNPEGHQGYGNDCWGLTASDGPFGYSARDATPSRDDGTITPTAALSSMPYTPDESLAALKHFYREHGADLWGPMGFYDAFNLDENWFASSYLAIDQGPIICMIENHRTALLWDNFMKNPEIHDALDAIGFESDSVSVGLGPGLLPGDAIALYPNPVSSELIIESHWHNSLGVEIYNSTGSLFYGQRRIAHGETLSFQMDQAPPGLYLVRVSGPDGAVSLHKVSRLP